MNISPFEKYKNASFRDWSKGTTYHVCNCWKPNKISPTFCLLGFQWDLNHLSSFKFNLYLSTTNSNLVCCLILCVDWLPFGRLWTGRIRNTFIPWYTSFASHPMYDLLRVYKAMIKIHIISSWSRVCTWCFQIAIK